MSFRDILAPAKQFDTEFRSSAKSGLCLQCETMFGKESSSTVAVEKSSTSGGEALQEKALQLAYFIIGDRDIAAEILSNALSKLQVQRSREAKRSYWRSRYLKRKITRMVRGEADTLQWLICFAAERCEKRQERTGEPTEREMVIRYIKHLVQVTTAMSSFYVNVGINRLLRDYSTPEVREVYEWVTQHFPSNQEYRKVKAALMRKLQLRFGDFLKSRTGQHGEFRFDTFEDQACWAGLVSECLKVFTPWSTDRACQALSNAGYRLDSLPRERHAKTRRGCEQDVIEANRCHVFLHPSCYSQVTKALGLDSPESRLAVPQFSANRGSGSSKNSGAMPMSEPLTEQERRKFRERLSVESERCRRVKPKLLKIVVDDVECARLVNCQGSKSQCQIEEGANLIEIWTDDEGDDLLLATHWIEYTRPQGIAQAAATVDLGDGRELLLEIMPGVRRDDASYAELSLRCRPASRLARVRELLMSRSLWLYGLPKYALLSLLILSVGWRIRTNQEQRGVIERLGKELAQEKEARDSVERALRSQQQAPEAYLLVPDEIREDHGRGGEGAGEPIIALSATAAQVILDLPTPRNLRTPYRAVLKSFPESHEILVENFPKPADVPQPARVEFVLPRSFVQTGKHYVVELNSISSTGHSERIHIFTFYVSLK